MSDAVVYRRQMRALGVGLTALWGLTAVAVAAAYRPGGPLDVLVAGVAFVPVLAASAGAVWPPTAGSHRHRVALAWLWIMAVLFGIPVAYGVTSALTSAGPQNLVPSLEAAYAAVLAVLSMTAFSVTGFVHERRRAVAFERRATLLVALLAALLTTAMGALFVLIALVNEGAMRSGEPLRSPYGPTDVDRVPPFCDEPLALGRAARIHITARSLLDDEVRGGAVVSGQRSGDNEVWSGTWSGPDGAGQGAYLRIGRQAWLSDQDAPGTPSGADWEEMIPDPFDLLGEAGLTLDGPPHALVNVPRGSIVAEDLGLEVVEGAPARHCRTFVDGPTALSTFLPLRWLLFDSHDGHLPAIGRWRGELDWWVFGDGELGRARVEVSGSRADTDWQASGVRAVLEARLNAVDRDRPADISAPSDGPGAALQSAAP